MRLIDRTIVWFNRLRANGKYRYAPGNVLLLLPHCIQNRACREAVKDDIRNCKLCGRCKIKDLKTLAELFHVPTFIASGGREALRQALSPQVKVIVAVACTKELSEGIRATFPKKVIGVLNSWPHGPCTDTDVSVTEVESVLARIITPSPAAK